MITKPKTLMLIGEGIAGFEGVNISFRNNVLCYNVKIYLYLNDKY